MRRLTVWKIRHGAIFARRMQRALRIAAWLVGAVGAGLVIAMGAGIALRQPQTEILQPAAAAPPAALGTEPVEPLDIVFGTGAQRPGRTPDLFPTDAREILCFYDFTGERADQELACDWYAPGQAMARIAKENWQPDRRADHARGTFVLRAPKSGMVAGIHEAEIVGASGPIGRASFCVMQDAAKITNGTTLTVRETRVLSLVATDSVTADGKPGAARTEFPATGRIYAIFQYQGAEPGMAFAVAWYADDEPIPQAAQDVVITAADGWGQAWIETTAASPLPPGSYKVTVSLPGATSPSAEAKFTVR